MGLEWAVESAWQSRRVVALMEVLAASSEAEAASALTLEPVIGLEAMHAAEV